MSWARFDDNAYDHPKLEKAGDDAGMLWFRSILWSRKHRTGGFVPFEILRKLTTKRDPQALAKRLVDAWVRPGGAGLFEHADGGYQIHDFEDFGPPTRESTPPEEQEPDAGPSRRSVAARKAAAARWSNVSPDASAPHDASDANASAPHDASDANASAPHDASDANSDAPTHASRADAGGHARAGAPAFPTRPVPEEKEKHASACEPDPLVTILAGSRELRDAGVDLDRLASQLRADTIPGGWSEKRIAECLPYALDALALSRTPDKNPLAFVAKVVRRVAPPRQLEAELEKAKPKAEPAPLPKQSYRGSESW